MEKNIIKVNISDIKDRRLRTLLYCLNDVYRCELQPENELIDNFVDLYIPEVKEFIYQYVENDYKDFV